MTATIKTDAEKTTAEESVDGKAVEAREQAARIRQRFVRRAQVLTIVGLALAWMVELGGESISVHDRGRRRDFVAESMLWDLQNGGTAIGVYPSSRANIITRWTNVIYDDQQQWSHEDMLRVLNWVVLLTFSGGAAFLFFTGKGKACLENFVENGVPS